MQPKLRFEIGQQGEINGQRFKVIARVEYEGDDGTWDEWCLQLPDDSLAWLEYEDGQIVLMRKQRLTTVVPPANQVGVGTRLQVNGRPFFVVERCPATVINIEGQLPYPLAVGASMFFLDGNISGMPAVLEYGDDAIELGMGEIIDRSRFTPDVSTGSFGGPPAATGSFDAPRAVRDTPAPNRHPRGSFGAPRKQP